MIDEYNSSDIQGDQMKGESGVNHRIIAEFHSSDIERDQVES